jgi:hypothetical protein
MRVKIVSGQSRGLVVVSGGAALALPPPPPPLLHPTPPIYRA